MSATTVPGVRMASAEDTPRRVATRVGAADRIFHGIARAGGAVVLVIMLLVGGFLLYRGWQALRVRGLAFITTQEWAPETGVFGVAALIFGTVMIALVSLVISVPLALGAALYISEYASGQVKRTLISLVDLMAAVPSIVYGLWGAFLVEGNLVGVARWISTYFGWIPLFSVTGADPRDPLASQSVYTKSTLLAGLVVAMMVAPIACSVMREVFAQAPTGEREGAYALGATRWGMIQSVVLPFGRGGIIGGSMLGLGRALGETIGVYLTISLIFRIQPHILEAGTTTVSATIAARYSDSSDFAVSALMAAGLTLFVLTLIVNFVASSIIARSRSGQASEV
jgi:phosphate transport system permease protein